MPEHRKKINAVFYKTEAGAEPVRDWLRSLSKDDRFKIGTDIMTVEYGWPVGICIEEGHMFLLHGFI